MKGPLQAQDERGLWFARALAVLYLALVVHLTLLPAQFGVSGHRFAWHLVGMVLALAPRHVSLHLLSDVAANVTLYVPLGLLGVFVQRSPRPRGAAAGFALSLGLELLQAATRDRVASLLDVAANGAGHVAGYRLALWLAAERGVSHAALVGGLGANAPARAAGALRSAYVTAFAALSLLPYDVTVSAGRIWAKALADGSEPGRVYLFLATPWDASRAVGVLLALALTLPVGALARLAAAGPPRWLRIALQGLLVAGAVEGGQVFVASRTADVAQALAGVPGALLGAWLVGLRTRSDVAGPAPSGTSVRTVLAACVASWTTLVWTEAWAPFTLEPSWQQAARKLVFRAYWLPLSAYAHGSVAAWGDLGREIGMYVPLGLFLGAWADRSRAPSWGRRRLAPALAIAALGCALEASQCLIAGRTVDVTDALSHALGGMLGLGLASLLPPPRVARPPGAGPAA